LTFGGREQRAWRAGRNKIPVCQDAEALYNRYLAGASWKRFEIVRIIGAQITLDELRQMASATFGNMVKAVVDINRELLAIDGELHSDLEALLIENGSRQQNLWGINLYPEMTGDEFVEFDSMINVRPSRGNRSRGVESAQTRDKILEIVAMRVSR
jgi:hypothetical protein